MRRNGESFFFTHDAVKRRAPFFTQTWEKLTLALIYSRLFFGTWIASSLCVSLGRTRTRHPFGTISSGVKRRVKKAKSRKRLSRTRRKRAFFRFTSNLVAQLCLKRRLASLSEVENRRKKWLTFDAEVDEYGSRILFQLWSRTYRFPRILRSSLNSCFVQNQTTARNAIGFLANISNEDVLFSDSRSVGKIFGRGQYDKWSEEEWIWLSRISTQRQACILNESLNLRQRYKLTKTKFRCLFSRAYINVFYYGKKF